ncbi:LOW QUALITY PROTEIN: cysteinyl leukotriene receptor 2-like [Ascaphus truei]|uniref:LOW QUALITY PROTEIN: cysteinyl leukotriene receptor 2-like n=1 Tax=Ascaphus truei TaxID=8439 RepID=UPI003F5A698A
MEETHDNQQFPGNDSIQCEADDEYKYHAYTAVYIFVFVLGLLFNGAALYFFCRVNIRKGITTICLMNLTIADLIFIMFLPMRISYYQNGAVWNFGDVLCRLTAYSFFFSMYSSIFFLACLSALRYVFTVHPVMISIRTVVKLCAFVWVFTGVSTLPFLLSGTQVRENVTRCFEPSGLLSWRRIMYMNYYALIFGFLAPFLTILICNGLLIRHIIQTSMTKGIIRKHATLIFLVLLVFSVSLLPYHIQRTVHLHYLVHHPNICSLHDVLQRTVVATLCLAILNSCLDPLLYVFLGHGFKSWLLLICRYKYYTSNLKSSSTNPFGIDTVLREEELEMD